jgi:hypothetical protein
MSRDTQFQNAFYGFMEKLSSDLKHMMQHTSAAEEFNLDPVSHWTLTRSNRNSVNKATQRYDLDIPRDVLIGYEDRRPAPEEGGEWSTPDTPIMSQQYVPTHQCFIEALDEHFRDYYYLDSNDEPISYVKVASIVAPLVFGDKLTVMIDVVYFRSHRPYPRPLTELQLANLEITRLEFEKFYEEKKIRILKRQSAKFEAIAKNMHAKFQRFIRTLYTEAEKQESCPVCYVDIDTTKMYVPVCSHLICGSCAQRCNDKCPICRDAYFGLEEEPAELEEGEIVERVAQ